ncbi:MAG: hypothetical protein GVY20_14330 [Bacteroidetes bacterium]|jgi:hypothetical protein|nr:hypothetical protein [Bacteroidota bacterium]
MARKIEVNACELVPVFKKDKKIEFRSTDGNKYTLECASIDCSFTDDLPLTIPANGDKAKLKIKNNASDGTYALELSCPEDDDIVRPTMIIKVE